MAHFNLNKLPLAAAADEEMQVEAAEDQNPPPRVVSATAGTLAIPPVEIYIPLPPPPMGEVTVEMPELPAELGWLHIVQASAALPPPPPPPPPHGTFLHHPTSNELPSFAWGVPMHWVPSSPHEKEHCPPASKKSRFRVPRYTLASPGSVDLVPAPEVHPTGVAIAAATCEKDLDRAKPGGDIDETLALQLHLTITVQEEEKGDGVDQSTHDVQLPLVENASEGQQQQLPDNDLDDAPMEEIMNEDEVILPVLAEAVAIAGTNVNQPNRAARAAGRHARRRRRRPQGVAGNVINPINTAQSAEAGRSQSRRRRRFPPLTSQYQGVVYNRYTGWWDTRFWDCGVERFLGSYSTEEEAARSFDRAVLALNVQKFLHKINFKPAEQYQAGLERLRHLTRNQMLMFLQRDCDGPAAAVLKYPFVTKMENGTFAAHYKTGFRWGIGGYRPYVQYTGMYATEEEAASAVYHKAMAENNMRVAQDILDIRIVRMLPTTAQQAAIDAETLGVAQGANGTIVEAGIADAILQLQDREALRPRGDGPSNNRNA